MDGESAAAAYEKLVQEQEAIADTLIEREHEVEQHSLVIKTLQAQDGDRKAWRLVGDVLVERTVKEVLPEVQTNRDNLATMVTRMSDQLKKKQQEVLAFQEKYKVQGTEGQQRKDGASGSGAKEGTQGVLVTNE